MAIIVKLKDSDKHAVLVGVGYGMYKSAKPNMFFGDLLSDEKSGESEMAAVSTAAGEILWWPSSDFTIVSIDGEAPSKHLEPYFENKPQDQ